MESAEIQTVTLADDLAVDVGTDAVVLALPIGAGRFLLIAQIAIESSSDRQDVAHDYQVELSEGDMVMARGVVTLQELGDAATVSLVTAVSRGAPGTIELRLGTGEASALVVAITQLQILQLF